MLLPIPQSNSDSQPCHGEIRQCYAVIWDSNIKDWLLVPVNCCRTLAVQ
jgi:hypothetical protein